MHIQLTHPSIPQNRALLARVISGAVDVIDIDTVTKALGVSRTEGAKRLSRWTEQGWLRRVGRGLYVPASLDTLDAPLVLDDAWVLVPSLYSPGYITGRTAAEHWDLTEQIFNDVVVLTGRALREKRQVRHGVQFVLKHIDPTKIFGTKGVWRHQTKVQVADVHRTVIDMLDDPALGGGIQHVADCLAIYVKRPDRDDRRLIEYAERLGNGAVFKRLGFLAERIGIEGNLTKKCRERLTAGVAKLDPALSGERLVSRWRLRVPPTWTKERLV